MSASGSSELNALRKKLNEAMGENFAQYMMFLRQEQIVDKISYEVFKKLINLFGLQEIILLSKSIFTVLTLDPQPLSHCSLRGVLI